VARLSSLLFSRSVFFFSSLLSPSFSVLQGLLCSLLVPPLSSHSTSKDREEVEEEERTLIVALENTSKMRTSKRTKKRAEKSPDSDGKTELTMDAILALLSKANTAKEAAEAETAKEKKAKEKAEAETAKANKAKEEAEAEAAKEKKAAKAAKAEAAKEKKKREDVEAQAKETEKEREEQAKLMHELEEKLATMKLNPIVGCALSMVRASLVADWAEQEGKKLLRWCPNVSQMARAKGSTALLNNVVYTLRALPMRSPLAWGVLRSLSETEQPSDGEHRKAHRKCGAEAQKLMKRLANTGAFESAKDEDACTDRLKSALLAVLPSWADAFCGVKRSNRHRPHRPKKRASAEAEQDLNAVHTMELDLVVVPNQQGRTNTAFVVLEAKRCAEDKMDAEIGVARVQLYLYLCNLFCLKVPIHVLAGVVIFDKHNGNRILFLELGLVTLLGVDAAHSHLVPAFGSREKYGKTTKVGMPSSTVADAQERTREREPRQRHRRCTRRDTSATSASTSASTPTSATSTSTSASAPTSASTPPTGRGRSRRGRGRDSEKSSKGASLATKDSSKASSARPAAAKDSSKASSAEPAAEELPTMVNWILLRYRKPREDELRKFLYAVYSGVVDQSTDSLSVQCLLPVSTVVAHPNRQVCAVARFGEAASPHFLKVFDRNHWRENAAMGTFSLIPGERTLRRSPRFYERAWACQRQGLERKGFARQTPSTVKLPYLEVLWYELIPYRAAPPKIKVLHVYAAFQQLVAVHQNGLVHCDVRLANLLLNADDTGERTASDDAGESVAAAPAAAATAQSAPSSSVDLEQSILCCPGRFAFWIDFDLSVSIQKSKVDEEKKNKLAGARGEPDTARPKKKEPEEAARSVYGDAKYPNGYVYELPDAVRHPDATAARKVQPFHDFYAFFALFAKFYAPACTTSGGATPSWWFTVQNVDTVFAGKSEGGIQHNSKWNDLLSMNLLEGEHWRDHLLDDLELSWPEAGNPLPSGSPNVSP
jgi:hypothetical protein